MGTNALPHLLERRQLLKYGAAALGTHLLAGCGGGDDPLPDCQPIYDEAGQWITDTCSHGSGEPTQGYFSVDGRQILKDGVPFFAQGVCYAPQPVGASFDFEPWGDFFTDFWDKVFMRDLPMMKKMGINTIRLYSTLPFRGIEAVAGAAQSHKKFLDACLDNGIFAWVGYPIDGGVFLNPKTKARVETGVKEIARQIGSHPAVMGFIMGNEANLSSGFSAAENRQVPIKSAPDFWAWIDKLGEVTKQHAPMKLTMTCLIDDSMESVDYAMQFGGLPNIDVIGINSYRGNVTNGFDNLFSRFEELTRAHPHALLITEFGCPASTRSGTAATELPNNAKEQADYISVHWQDIVKNKAVASGGYVFAWSDEWWKAGDPPVHNVKPETSRIDQFPGHYWDEEWFGIYSIQPDPRRKPSDPVNSDGSYYPDILTPRAAVAELTKLWTAAQ